MTTIPQVGEAMQQLLIEAAQAADVELHYSRRPDQAKFSASTLVQTLVFGWLAHPDASLEQLSHTAARSGVELSAQAIDQRLNLSTAELLKRVLLASLDQVIASDPLAIPILQRFRGVRIHDSTTIVLPDALADTWQGCGGTTETNTQAALKCGVQFDLLTGALCGLDLAAGRASDHRLPVQHAPLPKGSLRLADLGFYDLRVFAALSAAEVYWLTKIEPTAVVGDTPQTQQSVLTFVEQLGHVAQWQGTVWVGKAHRLQARLLVQRVPQEVADGRRRRIGKSAREKGVTPSAAALALAGWTVLLTNIPAELLSVQEAMVVAKVRWQIELLFKLWKSHGQIDVWRSGKPGRILCEVYAKLLAMVIQQWSLVIGCWSYAERSLVKASQVVRDHACELASARGRLEQLIQVLETIQHVLKRTARMNARRKHPNTYQLLLALTTEPKQA